MRHPASVGAWQHRIERCSLLIPFGIALGLLTACVQPPAGDLVTRVIRARGGPLPRFERESQVTVHHGLTGTWQWRIELRGPGSLQLTIVTSGEDQRWETDGEEARTYLGNGLVSRGPLRQSELASIARWVELIHLDALADASRFSWKEISDAALPAEVAIGMTVRCVGTDCGEYHLFFDEALRLWAIEGPLTIPTAGHGQVRARFHDFRRSSGLELPFEAAYTNHGAPLLDERVVDFHVPGN